MPKREFIPNIDDANAELVRLDTELAGLSTVQLNLTNLTTEKATVDGLLVTANETIATHLGTIAAKDVTINAATAQKVKDDAEIVRLQGEVQTAKGLATKQIAKAGAAPVKEAGTSGQEDAKDELKGLTGLARATKARQLAIERGEQKLVG